MGHTIDDGVSIVSIRDWFGVKTYPPIASCKTRAIFALDDHSEMVRKEHKPQSKKTWLG